MVLALLYNLIWFDAELRDMCKGHATDIKIIMIMNQMNGISIYLGYRECVCVFVCVCRNFYVFSLFGPDHSNEN